MLRCVWRVCCCCCCLFGVALRLFVVCLVYGCCVVNGVVLSLFVCMFKRAVLCVSVRLL